MKSYLRRAREKNKMTLDEVACAVGKTSAYISQLESKVKTNPSANVLNKLVELFGESILLDTIPALKTIKKEMDHFESIEMLHKKKRTLTLDSREAGQEVAKNG